MTKVTPTPKRRTLFAAGRIPPRIPRPTEQVAA